MGALCDDDDMYVEARKTALAAQQEEHTQMKQHEIHRYKQVSQRRLASLTVDQEYDLGPVTRSLDRLHMTVLLPMDGE